MCGTTTAVLYSAIHDTGYRDEEKLVLLAGAGFRQIDYHFVTEYDERKLRPIPFLQDDWRRWCLGLRAAAERLGLSICQAHAPTPPCFPDSGESDAGALLDRSIEAAALMGAKVIVMHPDAPPGKAGDTALCRELNKVFFTERASVAKKAGIQIAIENMISNHLFDGGGFKRYGDDPMEIIRLTDAIGCAEVGVCLDTGHCHYMCHEAAPCIEAAGDRLIALHLHDNDQFCDAHLPPFQGTIAWAPVMQALRRIHYRGVLMLESVNLCRKAPRAAPEGPEISV